MVQITQAVLGKKEPRFLEMINQWLNMFQGNISLLNYSPHNRFINCDSTDLTPAIPFTQNRENVSTHDMNT